MPFSKLTQLNANNKNWCEITIKARRKISGNCILFCGRSIFVIFSCVFFLLGIRPYFRSTLDVISIHSILLFIISLWFFIHFSSSYSIYLKIIILIFLLATTNIWIDWRIATKKNAWKLKMNANDANNIINIIIIMTKKYKGELRASRALRYEHFDCWKSWNS